MLNTTISLYYCNGPKGLPNFGDACSPYIVKSILNCDINRVSKDHTATFLVAVGSVADNVSKNGIIWGSGMIKNGIIWGSGMIKEGLIPGEAKVVGLRGKLSCIEFLKHDVDTIVIGDPVLLLPLLIPKNINIRTHEHKIGLIIHYVDSLKYDNIYPIDILRNVEDVVKDILSCDFIISSCLHGFIASQAFEIDCVPVKFSENLVGGEFKFKDYLTGIGFTINPNGESLFEKDTKVRYDLMNVKELSSEIIDELKTWGNFFKINSDKIKKIQRILIESFPFAIKYF